ncbi:hypothetical protein ABEF79_01020 [Acinetobacter sp. ANC 7454]|uniref:hypothetical protein n=1 Tax=Acinetobacter thermotolerans TaxID=3151487 RepID=UPI00325A9352
MIIQNISLLWVLKSIIIGYIKSVRCKIIGLALTGYNYEGAYSPLRAFFMRNISMHPHLLHSMQRYVGLGRDTFGCAGFLCSRSVNLLKLHTNHLTVTCVAFTYKGAHSS